MLKTNDNISNLTLSCDCELLVPLNASEFEYVDGNTISFDDMTLAVQFNTSNGLPNSLFTAFI